MNNSPNNKIILFGGTFDPPHYGHLILAQYAKEFLNAEKVIFIPCYKPPHKINYKLTHYKHRLNMLILATKDNKGFEVSRYEIKKKGISYTYRTVNWFYKKYSKKQIYFLIGFDSLINLTTWQKWQEIIKKVIFLVGERIVDKDYKNLPEEIYERIVCFDSPVIEISSTEIRNRVKKSLSIRYFVCESVEKYIIKNKLYK
ncbi:MAG: nicotinate-nucleotide adenylyltransferase [Endomicrobiia bacterium]